MLLNPKTVCPNCYWDVPRICHLPIQMIVFGACRRPAWSQSRTLAEWPKEPTGSKSWRPGSVSRCEPRSRQADGQALFVFWDWSAHDVTATAHLYHLLSWSSVQERQGVPAAAVFTFLFTRGQDRNVRRRCLEFSGSFSSSAKKTEIFFDINDWDIAGVERGHLGIHLRKCLHKHIFLHVFFPFTCDRCPNTFVLTSVSQYLCPNVHLTPKCLP